MKTTSMIKILSVTAFLIIAFTAAGYSQTKEIIIQTTAQCGECKTNIEKALMAEKGVFAYFAPASRSGWALSLLRL